MSIPKWCYIFDGGTAAFIVEEDGTTVAKISVTENSTAHSDLCRNVRLMSYAPEMLDALRQISLCANNSSSSKHEIGKIARDTIERVTMRV